MIESIQGDVRAGKPLSESLRKFPREFPTLYANMIQAGEVSGQLAPVMERLADFLEKEQIRRSQIIAAMTYPTVLITVALLAVTAVGNTVTAGAVMEARDGVRQGETLSGSLSKAGGFLPLVVHMTGVGEQTGRLSQMLIRTANTLDFEVDNTMRRLTSLVEPLV